ncbi:MAG TPA: hypothetical protein VGH34_20800 [Vicinamibacterales bacterium]
MAVKLTVALASSVALFCASIAHAQSSRLPPPWKAADVGAVETAGSVAVGTNNDWHVSGDGSDIWGSADSFFYVYHPSAMAESSRTLTARRTRTRLRKRAS